MLGTGGMTMREILFRGKQTDNGEWVEGYYLNQRESLTDKKACYIATNNGYGFNYISVIPETVGQYTGLTDKNGRKIFEGDILGGFLDEEYPEHKTIVAVEWYEGMWVTHQGNCCPDLLEKGDVMDWFEVIGNIYDNPELLKGGTDNG